MELELELELELPVKNCCCFRPNEQNGEQEKQNLRSKREESVSRNVEEHPRGQCPEQYHDRRVSPPPQHHIRSCLHRMSNTEENSSLRWKREMMPPLTHRFRPRGDRATIAAASRTCEICEWGDPWMRSPIPIRIRENAAAEYDRERRSFPGTPFSSSSSSSSRIVWYCMVVQAEHDDESSNEAIQIGVGWCGVVWWGRKSEWEESDPTLQQKPTAFYF